MQTFVNVSVGTVWFVRCSVVDGVDRTTSNNFRDTRTARSCATDLVNSLASLCIVSVLLPIHMG